MKEPSADTAHTYLSLADEAMRSNDFELALQHVRKVYETDPRNMYAHAYEERILMAMAEQKAKKDAEVLVEARMRSFIASQPKQEKKPSAPKPDPVKAARAKLDGVMKEIDEGTQLAKERLFELILQRTADPSQAVEKARESVADLSSQYRQRMETIKDLMIVHEKELVMSLERAHQENARKLYRSMAYMMQKMGVRFQHRESLLHLVAFFAQLSDQDEKSLRHSALLGIYEDLLKQLYTQEGPSKESLKLLDKTRTDFGISEDEHVSLMEHAKNEMLVTEFMPSLSIIEDDQALADRMAKAILTEFPKVTVRIHPTPDDFMEKAATVMPEVLITSTLFEGSTRQGLDLLREIRTNPSAREHATQTVLMVSATDAYFKEAVEELGLAQIIQKPFTNDLLMWYVRPLILKASGAPIENFYLSK